METTGENKNSQMSLRWNGFTDNIITSLESSLGNQDFVDVTLVCEGGSIKAHRLVLSACSYFFQKIFKENICPHPVVVLKGISLSELEALLMFMYHGEARTSEENIPRLLEAAQFLEIRGLSSHECSQVTSDPCLPSEATEQSNNTEHSEHDPLHTGIYSTTPSCEFSGLFAYVGASNPNVEAFNPNVRTTCHKNNKNVEEERSERVHIDIKQEPSEEEESNSQEFCGQTVPSQQLVSKTKKLEDKVNSRLKPKTNFSVQEMIVLQLQKKLAFFEPRECPRCHRMYRDAASLRNHISIMHEVLRHEIYCTCGSVFTTKYDYHVHRKKDHKGLV